MAETLRSSGGEGAVASGQGNSAVGSRRNSKDSLGKKGLGTARSQKSTRSVGVGANIGATASTISGADMGTTAAKGADSFVPYEQRELQEL